jgi:hypothetical protein
VLFAVAVGAEDVALRDLVSKFVESVSVGDQLTDAHFLLSIVAVVVVEAGGVALAALATARVRFELVDPASKACPSAERPVSIVHGVAVVPVLIH